MADRSTEPDRPDTLEDVKNDPIATRVMAAIITAALLQPIVEGMSDEGKASAIATVALKAAEEVRKVVREEQELARLLGGDHSGGTHLEGGFR